MPKRSAGLLMYRNEGALEVLLVHPGGPYWARKDDGAWSIPKGEYTEGEDPAAVAAREFCEELGSAPPTDGWLDLGEVTQAGGKRVCAWAVAGNLDPSTVVSNTFEMEWPPRSGTLQSFPEIDRAEWFDLSTAQEKVNSGQRPLIEALVRGLEERARPPD